MGNEVAVAPFAIDVDEAILTDLRDRVARTNWPRRDARSGWDDGADEEYLRSLLNTWVDDYDWREHESALNLLGQYRANVDGQRVHFVHERGKGPNPLPLILTHGFPSSFAEYVELVPLLTDPAGHGGHAADAFDVVVPSLPGYAFSDPPSGPWLESGVADTWCRLMVEGLGYRRFGAHGSDVGSGVTMQLARGHAEHVIGAHTSAFYLDPPPEPHPPAVSRFLERAQRERGPYTAYSRMQSTRPWTVAYGLSDSPAGLAAWIVDVFRSFSDCGGDPDRSFTRDQLLTNLTIYWVTGTAGSSMRPYYDYERHGSAPTSDGGSGVPAGFAVFVDSFHAGAAKPPREMAEHAFNVARWTQMPRGGHFAAFEEPELLVEDIRAFFRPLRGAGA